MSERYVSYIIMKTCHIFITLWNPFCTRLCSFTCNKYLVKCQPYFTLRQKLRTTQYFFQNCFFSFIKDESWTRNVFLVIFHYGLDFINRWLAIYWIKAYVYRYSIQQVNFEKRWLVGFMVLTPLSTIFQVYPAGQFY